MNESEPHDYDDDNFCWTCGEFKRCRDGGEDGFGFNKWFCEDCDESLTPAFPLAGKVVLLFVMGGLCAMMFYLTIPKV